MKKFIYISTQFTGFHKWEEAPEEVSYLRSLHRHVFYVKIFWKVTKDRELEFFIQKKKVDSFLKELSLNELGSCESIAEKIFLQFNANSVQVSEDGENGAFISK